MHLCIHQSFLVVSWWMDQAGCINQQTNSDKEHQPAEEDHHEVYLHGETLTEGTYIEFFIFILPIDL